MTPAQVIVIIRLLAGIYGVSAGQLDCMIAAESDYNVAAVNGPCAGLAQWHPDTRQWLGEKARGDPAWLHGDIGEGPVFDLALMAYWVGHGRGGEWSTWEMCGGEGE